MTAEPLLHVLHEDDDLLVVNKPAGLVCHPTKQGEWSSLVGRVRLHLGGAGGRLVHRLDRETSGVVVLAKTERAARELGRLFETAHVRKLYLAIVHGRVPPHGVAIDARLGRDTASAVAIKDCVRPDGARARTIVRRLRTFEHDGQPFSLVAAAPRTGRKHQIRIHLAHAGHPIVGDKLYGGDERRYLRFVTGALTREDRQALRLPHHALHAVRISCTWRGRRWLWRAPVPALFDALAPDEDRAPAFRVTMEK